MIITKMRPYKEIKSQLKKREKIGIVSCTLCAQLCHTGGREVMKKLANRLKKDGFNVVDQDLIGGPCNYSRLEANELRGDVSIVLACDAGVYNLKKLFPKRRIIPALKTVGLGAYDNKGNIDLVRKFG